LKELPTKNVARAKKLDWWQAFKDRVSMEIRHTVESVTTSYERKKKWLQRQVFVTLAMFKKIMGNKGFKQYLANELLDAGARLNTVHEAFIQVYGRNNADIDFSWDVCNE